MKISSETAVPIGWLITAVSVTLSITIMGTAWVYSVNNRLARIEDKLGIAPFHNSLLEPAASAGEQR